MCHECWLVFLKQLIYYIERVFFFSKKYALTNNSDKTPIKKRLFSKQWYIHHIFLNYINQNWCYCRLCSNTGTLFDKFIPILAHYQNSCHNKLHFRYEHWSSIYGSWNLSDFIRRKTDRLMRRSSFRANYFIIRKHCIRR